MPSADSSTRLCIGLTGGIGCGKSTVAALFAKQGAGIIDTDEIAHQLTQKNGDAVAPIRATFGKDYLTQDDALDRPKMRNLIFSDASAKQQLESILHPLIFDQTKAELHQLQENKPYVIIVVPLLPESPVFRHLVQRVLVVDCAEDKQVERVIKRNGMSLEEVRAIIHQQTPRPERLRIADDVIHNDTDIDHLTNKSPNCINTMRMRQMTFDDTGLFNISLPPDSIEKRHHQRGYGVLAVLPEDTKN